MPEVRHGARTRRRGARYKSQVRRARCPEIVQDATSACPILRHGARAADRHARRKNPELDDMTHRFRWSSVITAPSALAFMVSEFLPGQPLQRMLPHGSVNWILFALATPVCPVERVAVLRIGWASVVNRYLNMFTLIALGVGAACAVRRIVATIAPGLSPTRSAYERLGDCCFEPAAIMSSWCSWDKCWNCAPAAASNT